MNKFATCLIAVLASVQFPNPGSADTCDPNSDLPIIAFSTKQDMSKAKITYEYGRYSCAFSNAQESHMNFKSVATNYSDFYDERTQAQFSCTEKIANRRQFATVTSRILTSLFTGTNVKLVSCQYASVAASKQTEGRETVQQKSAKSGSFNLQANERQVITAALNDSHGDTIAAAIKLGITEKALKRKMKEYQLDNLAK